ncbi:MAG: hypothetical protein ACXWAT_00360 [Methylobacter sp.]
MSIKIEQFGGIAPKVNPPLLAGNMAVSAVNCRVDSGALKPIKGTTPVATVPNTAKSIAKYAGNALYWSTAGIDVVEHSPIANDVWERLYYTGDGYPKYTFATRPSGGNANGLRLGVPRPSYAPTLGASSPNPTVVTAGSFVIGSTYTIASVGTTDFTLIGATANAVGAVFTATGVGTGTGQATLNDSLITYQRYYVYTYVTPQGEEGPPSPASAAITVTDTQVVTLTFTTESLSGYNLGTGAKRRIYRTAQGTSTTEYLYVGEVAIGSVTATDNLLDSELGEILPSTNWFPPPADMAGLKTTPNGFLIGFSGNALCVSEALLPHAWNPLNQLAFSAPITALAVTGDSIIVFTENAPYLVTGTTPDSLSAIRIDHPQTCASKASVVNMGGYVMFASPDGLVAVSANDMRVATLDFLTRDQWQAYSPSTMKGFFYEGFYLGFSDTKAFMFDMRGNAPVLTELSGFSFACGYNDLTTDTLYLLDSSHMLDSTWNIVSWETGSVQSLTWKSKPERLPAPICPAAFRIFAGGAVTFKLWADGDLKVNTTVSSSAVGRLPAGYKAKEFQIELSGTSQIDSVVIGTSVSELT